MIKKLLLTVCLILSMVGCSSTQTEEKSTGITFQNNTGYSIKQLDINLDEELKDLGYDYLDPIDYWPIAVNDSKIYFEIDNVSYSEGYTTVALFTLNYITKEIEVIKKYDQNIRVCDINFYNKDMIISEYNYDTKTNIVYMNDQKVLELTCDYLNKPNFFRLNNQVIGIYSQEINDEYQLGYFTLDESGFNNYMIDSYKVENDEYQYLLYPNQASNNNDTVCFYTYGNETKGYYIQNGQLQEFSIPVDGMFSLAIIDHSIFTDVSHIYNIETKQWDTIEDIPENVNTEILRATTLNDHQILYIDSVFNAYIGDYDSSKFTQLEVHSLDGMNIVSYYCIDSKAIVYGQKDNQNIIYILEV